MLVITEVSTETARERVSTETGRERDEVPRWLMNGPDQQAPPTIRPAPQAAPLL